MPRELPNTDLVSFRRVTTLWSGAQDIDIVRRNGYPVLSTNPRLFGDTGENLSEAEQADLRDVLCDGLTEVERRTWLKLINDQTLEAIAAEEGVSRTAIYCRLCGKNHRGGMLRKNIFVRLWWEMRQRGMLQ